MASQSLPRVRSSNQVVPATATLRGNAYKPGTEASEPGKGTQLRSAQAWITTSCTRMRAPVRTRTMDRVRFEGIRSAMLTVCRLGVVCTCNSRFSRATQGKQMHGQM